MEKICTSVLELAILLMDVIIFSEITTKRGTQLGLVTFTIIEGSELLVDKFDRSQGLDCDKAEIDFLGYL